MANPTFRPIDEELLSGLTLESTKVFPLAGATGRRLSGQADIRLSGLAGQTPVGDDITYYEHLATVRHAASGKFYVAFRETMDAFLARQQDPTKYPAWLMKSPEKQTERMIFLHVVTRKPTAVMTSHEQWLTPIMESEQGLVFSTVAYFLQRQGVITDAMYRKLA